MWTFQAFFSILVMMTSPTEYTPHEATPTARRQRTRDRLLCAALIVFARRGVSGTSIEELCEEAGMTRGAFYSNFASVDDLVLQLIDRAISTIVAGIRDIIQTSQLEHSGDGSTCDDTVEQQFTKLRDAAREALAGGGIDWTASIAWVITGAEIDLYTLRNPDLRARYLELQHAHFRTLGTEIDGVLTKFGARTSIPTDTVVGHLAAVNLRSAREAISPLDLEEAPIPDASELLAESMSSGSSTFDVSKLPAKSLLRPVNHGLDPVLDLLMALIRFD